jgi:predicted TIM-barrel fold metal-dependent hydrolase
MGTYNVISADAHIEAPPSAWTDRLPKDMRAEAPQVVALEDGGDGVKIGDAAPAPLGLQVTGGQRYSEFRTSGRSFADGLPGTGGPEQRVAEQKEDGTDGEVLFSAVVASALRKSKDDNVLCAIATAYNGWLSEYCSVAPERLLGVALLPPTNARDAAAEAERVAALPGIRGVQLLTFPNGGAWATYGDETFWQTVSDLDLPVIAHHNFGGQDHGKAHPLPGQKGESKALEIEGAVDLATFAWLLTCDLPMPTIPILTIEQLFLGGVLDRYPKLRFHFAETGIGWLPYWLEQMDDRYERHRHWAGVGPLSRRPSDYVRDHFTFSFQEDHAGVALRHSIGIDNICWASDFPHSVSDWPFSRETRERQFKGVPDQDRRKMEALNIAAQLGLITKEEKEAQSLEPITPDAPAEVADRGARRSS